MDDDIEVTDEMLEDAKRCAMMECSDCNMPVCGSAKCLKFLAKALQKERAKNQSGSAYINGGTKLVLDALQDPAVIDAVIKNIYDRVILNWANLNGTNTEAKK
jgi:hypothetical protein